MNINLILSAGLGIITIICFILFLILPIYSTVQRRICIIIGLIALLLFVLTLVFLGIAGQVHIN